MGWYQRRVLFFFFFFFFFLMETTETFENITFFKSRANCHCVHSTVMVLGTLSGALGMVSLSTPSSTLATMPSRSMTPAGRPIVLLKERWLLSLRMTLPSSAFSSLVSSWSKLSVTPFSSTSTLSWSLGTPGVSAVTRYSLSCSTMSILGHWRCLLQTCFAAPQGGSKKASSWGKAKKPSSKMLLVIRALMLSSLVLVFSRLWVVGLSRSWSTGFVRIIPC